MVQNLKKTAHFELETVSCDDNSNKVLFSFNLSVDGELFLSRLSSCNEFWLFSVSLFFHLNDSFCVKFFLNKKNCSLSVNF